MGSARERGREEREHVFVATDLELDDDSKDDEGDVEGMRL